MDKQLLTAQMQQIVGKDAVLSTPAELAVYSYDGSIDRHPPELVVLPKSTEEVSAVVKAAAAAGVPMVARGAGTGLSGGSVPLAGGVVIGLARMRRILEINPQDRYAICEPGVVNIDLSLTAASQGMVYAPDPSSQTVCTLGGNVAENAGGPHCLLYGVTTNHVLGLEVVLPDGEIVQLGGLAPDAAGYDLRGVLIGSEGTLGIVTKIMVKLMPKPEQARTLLVIFDSLEDAGATVSTIIGQGIIPAAMEIMDALTMKAVEAGMHAGYPPDAEAVLLIEVDGLPEGLDDLAAEIEAVCRQFHAREIRSARTDEERAALWKGRKGAIGALGRLAPNYYIQDGVVPRSRLPEVLRYVVEVSKLYDIPVGNLLHAGDGNLHPNFLFDARDPAAIERVRQASGMILKRCVELGGTITGEHGVGLEKQDFMAWLFSGDDLEKMRKLYHMFNPQELLNPGKMFPGARWLGKAAPALAEDVLVHEETLVPAAV